MERFEPISADFLPQREAFTAALRVLIISACSRGEVATTPFAEMYDLRKGNVRYLFRRLREEGILRVSKEERAGGFFRRYYVAVQPRPYLDEEFAQMIPRERQGISLGVLWDLSERCREACEAGTVNALPGTHLSRFDLLLDLEGWTAVMVELKRIFDCSFEIQAEALNELEFHPALLLEVTFALAGFEAPKPSRQAPGETRLSRRCGPSWAVAANFRDHARGALRDGTMDARDDSHLTWSPLVLTPRTWHDLSIELSRSRKRILDIQEAATPRLALSNERAIPTTAALFGFKSAGLYNPSAERPLVWPPHELSPFHP
jgi:hypothetical protein